MCPTAASACCPHEIEQLFPQVEVGTPVKIIYRPIKLALTPQGRVYLEAIPNIYEWELHSLEWVKDMAEYYNLTDRIDWDKVPPILKTRSGLAQDITKAGAPPIPPPVPRPGHPPAMSPPVQGERSGFALQVSGALVDARRPSQVSGKRTEATCASGGPGPQEIRSGSFTLPGGAVVRTSAAT